jgi:hypothetical protein
MMTAMTSFRDISSLALLSIGVIGQQAAPTSDPIAGNWRGTIKPATGVESPFIITLVKRGDTYSGITTGLGGIGEVPLKTVSVAGNRITFEAVADSKLGAVVIRGDLLVEANRASGAGSLAIGPQAFDVALALQRRGRRGRAATGRAECVVLPRKMDVRVPRRRVSAPQRREPRRHRDVRERERGELHHRPGRRSGQRQVAQENLDRFRPDAKALAFSNGGRTAWSC